MITKPSFEPGSYSAAKTLILIFHGAEVFDTGDAGRLIDLLHPEQSLVAGVMARTAAGESGLPVIYDGRKPSEILKDYRTFPVILVHRAKTEKSAHQFGSLIASRIGYSDLIMIEPATTRVFLWGKPSEELVGWILERTGFIAVQGKPSPASPPDIRSIGGCLPGEPVFINGVIIGHATSDEVVIGYHNGHISAVSGVVLKDHGVEKLMRTNFSDLAGAWCKSGPVRTQSPRRGKTLRTSGIVEVIDHRAEVCYASFRPDLCGLLTIGDDTTAICGHIGCSRGVPVLGITDGDIDGIVPEGYAKGSVVLAAVNERDDDLGAEIAGLVGQDTVIWNEWVDSVITRLGNRIRIVHRED